MTYDQQEFELRCEWGEQGLAHLAPISDVVIIVDVLSFCTSVDIAVRRGAVIYPFRDRGDSAAAYARRLGAELAVHRDTSGGYSLSPSSMNTLPPGTRLVLPSPNGSRLSLGAKPTPILAGCLRNAAAVAAAASRYGPRIAVIPAGERWRSDGSLRPSWEDLVGAGAIISHLRGRSSPEALVALAAFRAAQADLANLLRQCSSGKELIEKGFDEDVRLASQLDVSRCAPVLVEDAYVAQMP